MQAYDDITWPQLLSVLMTSANQQGASNIFSIGAWKFGVRMLAPSAVGVQRPWWLDDVGANRKIVVLGCPLGGQIIPVPSAVLQQCVVIDCVGHIRELRYGFCSRAYVTGTAETWQCPADAAAVTAFFRIMSLLRANMGSSSWPRVIFIGMSAGCQTLAAIAASHESEVWHWHCECLVMVAPAYHSDMRQLESESWVRRYGYVIFVCHLFDTCCKWQTRCRHDSLQTLVRRLQDDTTRYSKYFFCRQLTQINHVMWGRQCHDISPSILAQTQFWRMLLQGVQSNVSFHEFCESNRIGLAHMQTTPEDVEAGQFTSIFAEKHFFCSLIFLLCHDYLFHKLSAATQSKLNVADLVPATSNAEVVPSSRNVVDKLTRVVERVAPWNLHATSQQALARWCDMASAAGIDFECFLHRQSGNVSAEVLKQYCHAATYASVQAKTNSRDTICYTDLELDAVPVQFEVLTTIGSCCLLELKRPASCGYNWSLDWHQIGRDKKDIHRNDVMMSFMDILIITVADTMGREFRVICACMKEDHVVQARTKPSIHQRDLLKSLTVLCCAADINSLVVRQQSSCSSDEQPAADKLRFKHIVSIRTNSHFKTALRWSTSYAQKQFFDLACGNMKAASVAESPSPAVREVLQYARTHINVMSSNANQVFQVMTECNISNMSVILGPPGTGKTTLFVNFIELLTVSRTPAHRSAICLHVLVTASTFEAGCNVVERLVNHPGAKCDIILLVSIARAEKTKERFERHRSVIVATSATLSAQFSATRRGAGTLVLVTTYGMTAANETPYNDPLRPLLQKFDFAFSDEAGQVPAVETLSSLACFARRCFWFIVGDPRQLPPFSGNGRETVNLLRQLIQNVTPFKLLMQRRMTPVLGAVVSHLFYEARLLHTDVATWGIAPFAIVMLLDSGKCQCVECQSLCASGRGNFHEAQVVASLTKAIAASDDVCVPTVLAYYAAQKRCVKKLLERNQPSIDVATIDSTQGKEYDGVLITTGRRFSVGFAGDRRRLNVGISRGKHFAIVICTEQLQQHALWQNVFELATRLKVVIKVGMKKSSEHPERLDATDAMLGQRLLQQLRGISTAHEQVKAAADAPLQGGISLQSRLDALDQDIVGSLMTKSIAPTSEVPVDQQELCTIDEVMSTAPSIIDATMQEELHLDDIRDEELASSAALSYGDLFTTFGWAKFSKLQHLLPLCSDVSSINITEFLRRLALAMGEVLFAAIKKAARTQHCEDGSTSNIPWSEFVSANVPVFNCQLFFPTHPEAEAKSRLWTFASFVQDVRCVQDFMLFLMNANDLQLHPDIIGSHVMWLTRFPQSQMCHIRLGPNTQFCKCICLASLWTRCASMPLRGQEHLQAMPTHRSCSM